MIPLRKVPLNGEIVGFKLLLKLLNQQSCNLNVTYKSTYLKEDLQVCSWLCAHMCVFVCTWTHTL